MTDLESVTIRQLNLDRGGGARNWSRLELTSV